MENIKLLESSNNEDSSSFSIIHNKNMNNIAVYINYLLGKIDNGSNGSSLVRNKLVLLASESEIENELFKIEKVISNGVATFKITSKIDGFDMETVISEIRTFSNEKIICPTKYIQNTNTLEMYIDNLDDVNPTNPTNPNNDINNKIFIII